MWAESVSGSGSVVQAGGLLTLRTGITANSSAQYQTVNPARWASGQENTFRSVHKCLPLGTPNNVRRWGVFSSTDGFFFQLDNTGFSTVTRIGGVDILTPQTSWSIVPTITLDTNFHIWEIKMSFADVHWIIDHLMVNTFPIYGSNVIPSSTLNLPITITNANSGGGIADVSLSVATAFVMRAGNLENEVMHANLVGAQTKTLKYEGGKLHRVISNAIGGASATIYDNTVASGNKIATISLGSGSNSPFSLDYRCPFYNGLTIVTTGSGTDITVIYE